MFGSRKLAAALMLAPMGLCMAAPAAMAGEVQIQASGPIVELSISQSVTAKPDIARVSTGVSSKAPTAIQAMRKNAESMNTLISKLKSVGIAARDIQTSTIRLNAEYKYDRQRQEQVFQGYQASNRVTIVLRDIENAGQILDAMVAEGATDISGLSFAIEDDRRAKAEARKKALDTAKERAMQYANWAGYSGVRLLEVSENLSVHAPNASHKEANAMAYLSAAPVVRIEPGVVQTSVRVSVKYEMTQRSGAI